MTGSHSPVRPPSRRMRRSSYLALALAFPLTLGAAAYEGMDLRRIAFASESRLWVEGGSTVRSWSCEATKIDGTLTADATGRSIADVERGARGADLSVAVQALDCRNGTMNDHMRKALQAQTHPTIQYRMRSHESVRQSDGSFEVKMLGTLTIAGQQRPMEISAVANQESNGTIKVRGSAPFKMTHFGVKPPSLMLGMMKVHDDVTVHFEVPLVP